MQPSNDFHHFGSFSAFTYPLRIKNAIHAIAQLSLNFPLSQSDDHFFKRHEIELMIPPIIRHRNYILRHVHLVHVLHLMLTPRLIVVPVGLCHLVGQNGTRSDLGPCVFGRKRRVLSALTNNAIDRRLA